MKGPETIARDTGRPWLVVSFFTEANGYKPDALRMIASCERQGLDYFVQGIQGEGSWIGNVRYKPAFLRSMLGLHAGRDILWIDADGVVQQYPALVDDLVSDSHFRRFLLGVHYRAGRELLTNTVFFRNTEETFAMIDAWIALTAAMPGTWEQKTLQLLLTRHPEWPVFPLPAGYSQIFDLMRSAGKPVIEHFQASRRLRRPARPISTRSVTPRNIWG